MNGSFIPGYLVLVFFASWRVFQMAAACNGLRGLLFSQGRRWAFLFGLGLVVGAFSWFFLWEPRNVPDTSLGLTGHQQFGFFFAGSGASPVCQSGWTLCGRATTSAFCTEHYSLG